MKIKRSHLSIGLLILILSLTVAGGMNQSFKPQNALEIPKSNAGEITIVTPENKTYPEPDIGYYPATYGFENDDNGANPSDWTFYGSGGTVDVISDLGGHNKVLEFHDTSGAGYIAAEQDFGMNRDLDGDIIEFWLRTTNSINTFGVTLFDYGKTGYLTEVRIWDGYFKYFDGVDWQNFIACNNNQWYHHKIVLDFTNKEFDWSIDETFEQFDISFMNTSVVNFRSIYIGSSYTQSSYDNYFDALGYSWDPDYNIGDNLNEGLFLSYDNTTTLDWQGFSLDGQANKTIWGNTAIPMPIDGFHSIQVFGNDSIGTMYESNVRYFAVNAATSIGIITPENLTYTEPMSGYYPAAYGFENDQVGTIPEGWTDESPYSSCSISVYDQKDQHKQIVQIYDANTGTGADATAQYIFESPKVTGSIECWVYKESGDCALIIQGIDDTNAGFQISIDAENNGVFRYSSAPSTHVEFATGKYSDQKWFHLRIDFNCDTDTTDIYVNGIKEVDDGPFYLPVSDISFILIRSGHSGRSGILYFDAVGLSWDASYNIGENLNEGLLLSYSNNTNMEWVGYSLDGSPNITITGDKTIPFPENGIHSIVLNGITSIGMLTKSELRFFTIDTQDLPIPPEIPSPFPIIPIILASIGIGIIALLSITIFLLRRRTPSRTSSTIISHKKSQLDEVVVSGSDQFKVCPFCRTQVKKTNQFCTYCGASMESD